MSSTVQLRIDAKTKRTVSKIFHSLGLDLSTGVKIYFQQVLNHKGIPFPLLTKNGFTSDEETRLLNESAKTQKIYQAGARRGHKSAKKMFEELTRI